MEQNTPVSTNQIPSNPINPSNKPNVWKTLFFLLLFLILASGLVFAGYYFGIQKIKPPKTSLPTPVPTQTIIPPNKPGETEEFDDSDPQVKLYKKPVKVEDMGIMQMIKDNNLTQEGPGAPDLEKFDIKGNSDYYKIGIMKDPVYKDKELYLIHIKNLEGMFGVKYESLLRFIKDGEKHLILTKNSYYSLDQEKKQLPEKLIINNDFLIKCLKKYDYKISFLYQGKELIFEGGYSPIFETSLKMEKIGIFEGKDFYQETKKLIEKPTFRQIGELRKYFLKYPDTSYVVFTLSPNYIKTLPQQYEFGDKHEYVDVPSLFQINWTDGLSPRLNKDQRNIYYNMFDSSLLIAPIGKGKVTYYDKVMDFDEELIPIGSNQAGEKFYSLKDKNHIIYTDFYKNRDDYSDFVKNLTYEEFLANRPVFFWKDLFGDHHAMFRGDFEVVAGIAKPAVYLYPEKEMKVIVYMDPSLINVNSLPFYGNGWKVVARPDGTIISNNQTYDYLFYEGDKKGFNFKASETDIVKKENVLNYLILKLKSLGLNQKETNQFIEYWWPKMQEYGFYQITFMKTEDLDKELPLDIDPKPETRIRILMKFKEGTEEKEKITLDKNPPYRTGFTMVEWGGLKE